MKDILKGAKTIDQLHKKWLKRPGYKAAYEDLEVEYRIIDLLIKKRAEKNLTQFQLAKKLGLTQPVISKLESGNYNPSVKFLSKIAKGLDANLEITLS